jgi:hypothetical protein
MLEVRLIVVQMGQANDGPLMQRLFHWRHPIQDDDASKQQEVVVVVGRQLNEPRMKID